MNQLVFVENGQAVTDSLTIADVFNKRHSDVLRDIEMQLEKLVQAGEGGFGKRNFALSNYQSGTRGYKKYNLTEDAFTLVAMAYTTSEAMIFKIKFIEEFKKMRKELTKPKALSEHEQRVELLKLSLEHDAKLNEFDQRLIKVENNERINAFQQNVIKKQIGSRVYKVYEEHNPNDLGKNLLFPKIHRNFRDAFAISTYRDLRKLDFDDALIWIKSWRPLV
ncbi:Rha family transcriptional regulator [Bacillus sp. JJ722]|uniref:Rha family transcriptional regulator n=1 Tax=Bacillus sp. JJ722 TaxID=3122973 RepID=UPI002FFF74AB